MPHTGYDANGDGKGDGMPLQRYAVVSCHVERVLDDEVWQAFRRFQARRPGGFRIAALMRPPDPASDEGAGHADRDAVWQGRAREAAADGPFGLHTHFGGRENGRARPGDPVPADRVRDELAYLAAAGLEPRFFCGGNWYIDRDVAAVLAAAGLADCSATAFAPAHLAAGAPRLALAAPTWLRLDSSTTTGGVPAADFTPGAAATGALRLLELPTTHSLGMAVRAALSPTAPAALHCYFHDYDLLVPSRARALAAGLAVLGRRRRPVGLDELARAMAPHAPEQPFPPTAVAPALDRQSR